MGCKVEDMPILFASEIQPGRVELHADFDEQATKGCHLAVVGIFGDVNSGKSFLMNITAAYLQSEESESHGWMENLMQTKKHFFQFDILGQEAPSNNFSTEGIYMWHRPFILKHPTEANKRVAIILLHLKTKRACPTLELLMCLMCSTVIYDTTTTDVYPIFRLIESVRNTDSLFWFGTGIVKTRDLLLTQLTFLFRDVSGDVKGVKDKELKHLRHLMKSNEENCKFQEYLDMGVNIDSFLFKPLIIYQNEKAIVHQVKTFVECTVNVDDLAFKSYLSQPFSTGHFNEILRLLQLEIIYPLLMEFNKHIPLLETNMDDPMDTSEKSEVQDYEMEDLSQEKECSSQINHTNPCSEAKPQALMKSKSPESECEKWSDKNPQSPYNSVRDQLNSEVKIYNDSIIEKEIVRLENWIDNEIKTHTVVLKENKHPSKDIYEINDKVRKEFEKFCAQQNITNPAELLKTVEQRLFDKVCQTVSKIKDQQDHPNMKLQSREGSGKEKHPFQTAFDEDKAMKIYNEAMETFFKSTPLVSNQLNNHKHDQVCEDINGHISKYYVEETSEKFEVLKSMNEKIKIAYQSFANRLQANEDVTNAYLHHAREVVKYAKEGINENLKQVLANDTFLNVQSDEFVRSLLHKSIQQYSKTHSLSKEAIVEQVDKLDETRYLYELMQGLQKNLQIYSTEMNKKLQMHIFWTDDQLLKFDKSARSTFIEGFENKLPYLQYGLSLLKEKYLCINKLIQAKENHMIMDDSLVLKMKNFYNQEMREMLKMKMTSIQLKNSHVDLKQEIHQVILKACRYNDSNCSVLKSSFQKLNTALDEAFEIHNEKNKMKIEIIQKTIQTNIQKAQRKYNENMTTKIGHRILTAHELTNLHKECLNEHAILLKIALRPVVEENVQNHIESLKTRTARDLEMYVDENNSRIAAKEKRDEEKREEEQRERKKQEAAAELQRRKESQKISSPNRNDYNANKSTRTTSSDYDSNKWSKCASNDDTKKKSPSAKNFSFTYVPKIKIPSRTSPVIAIQFGLLKIKCGMYDKQNFTDIIGEWGELEYTNQLAITYDDELLIGEELQPNQANIKYHFHLTDILTTPSENLDEHHQLSAGMKFKGARVTKELICALLFSRIKENAETYLSQNVTKAVITVPLWYTSSQRQATKDAATIAGFTSVYLINEPTATALSYVNHETRISASNDFLVIVANDYRIDVAVYEYNQGKVKMLHCAGNTHFSDSSTLVRFLKSIKNNIPFTGKDEEMEDIKKIVKECVKSSKESQIKEYAVIYDGLNKDYERKLHDIAKRYGKLASYPLATQAVIVGSAQFAKFVSSDEKSARLYARDSNTFKFQMRKVGSKKPLEICDRLKILPLTDRNQSMDITVGREMIEYHVEEFGSDNHIYQTAFLQIAGIDGPLISQNKKLNFSINCEGILQLKNQTDLQNKEIVVVVWNLRQHEINNLSSLILNHVRKPPVFETNVNALLESRRQLYELAMALLNNLDNKSEIAKDQIEQMSESAIAIANHENSTPEEVERKLGILTKLKSKYL